MYNTVKFYSFHNLDKSHRCKLVVVLDQVEPVSAQSNTEMLPMNSTHTTGHYSNEITGN